MILKTLTNVWQSSESKNIPVLANVLQLPMNIHNVHKEQSLTELKVYVCCWEGFLIVAIIQTWSADLEDQSQSYAWLQTKSWKTRPQNLSMQWQCFECTDVIRAKGAQLENCFGFIAGMVRPIARPNWQERIFYNGHKRVHLLKFQSVALPWAYWKYDMKLLLLRVVGKNQHDRRTCFSRGRNQNSTEELTNLLLFDNAKNQFKWNESVERFELFLFHKLCLSADEVTKSGNGTCMV